MKFLLSLTLLMSLAACEDPGVRGAQYPVRYYYDECTKAKDPIQSCEINASRVCMDAYNAELEVCERMVKDIQGIAPCEDCPNEGEFMPATPSIKWVDLDHIAQLETGDIIRGKSSGEAYVVTAQYGSHASAVKTIDVSHASEWLVMRSVQPNEGH